MGDECGEGEQTEVPTYWVFAETRVEFSLTATHWLKVYSTNILNNPTALSCLLPQYLGMIRELGKRKD